MENFFKNLILVATAIVVAGVLIAGAIIISKEPSFLSGLIKNKDSNVLSGEEAAQKAINYINENLLREGVTASLISVVPENGLYKFKLKIGEREFESYVTKDAKILFETGIKLDEKPKTSVKQPPKKTCEEIKKNDNPMLEAFVVSKCPFGLQMQRILNEIVKNIPSLANNIKVEYMGSISGNKITAMHGDKEAQENLRQICIREEQPNKYWAYIDCHIKKGEVESCLASANVDTDKLTACMTDNSRGLKYAREDFRVQDKYNDTPECKKCMENPPREGCRYQCPIIGSPALILNGQGQPEGVSEFNFGGRTAEAVKTLLCCGFKTKPNFCSQKLSENSAAVGFSESYSKSSGSSSGGSGK